jgi:hypothetical protein
MKWWMFALGFLGVAVGLALILAAQLRSLEDIDLGGFALD